MQVSRITVLPMGTLRMTASAYMFACSKESNTNEDRTNIHPYYTLTVIGASASGCRAQIENTLHKTAPGCFQIIGADTPLQQFQPKHTSGIMVLLPELALLDMDFCEVSDEATTLTVFCSNKITVVATASKCLPNKTR